MNKVNFNNISAEEMRKLETEAWNGNLDYRDFPAPEYKFFDRVAEFGYRHRHEKIASELFRSDIQLARRTYERDRTELNRSREVYAERQTAILKSDELLCLIEKTSDHSEKLRYALEALGLITGDTKLMERNLRS